MQDTEFRALQELLIMLVTDPRMVVLFILLGVASVSDWRSLRIPNWVCFGGALFALVSAALMARNPYTGLVESLGGLAVGLLVMLPCYVLRVMGAGDVKLMAMVGAFLGAQQTLMALLWTFVVGGVAAIAFSLFHHKLAAMLRNVKDAAEGMALSAMSGVQPNAQMPAAQSAGKLPYAICIALGTAIQVLRSQLGWA